MPTIVGKLLRFVGFKPRNNMPDQKFQANNIIEHRYEKVDVLEKCLKEFGFKPNEWEINDQNKPGIRIRLPNGATLTDEQKTRIHEAYVEAHDDQLNAA